MTTRQVKLDVGRLLGTGPAEAVTATVSCSPLRSIDLDGTVVLPQPFEQAGGDTVTLEVNGASWAWRFVIESSAGFRETVRSIPAGSGVIALADCPEVDVKSLRSTPEPAWWAGLDGKADLPGLGGAALCGYGCSFLNPDNLVPGVVSAADKMYLSLFGARYGAGSVTSYAVGGTRINHVLASLLSTSTWPGLDPPKAGALWPGASQRRGPVVIDTLPNDVAHYQGTSYPVPIAEGSVYPAAIEAVTDAALAVIASESRREIRAGVSGVTLAGSWTTQGYGGLSDGDFTSTNTPGSTATLTNVVPPQSGPLAGRAVVGALQFDPAVFGNAPVSVKVDGGTATTWTPPGWEAYDSVAVGYAPIVVELPVDGQGHSIELAHAGTVAQLLCLDALLVMSEAPPDVYVMEAPTPVASPTWWNEARVATWKANNEKVQPRTRAAVRRWANALWVPTSVTAAGLSPDGLHPKDFGMEQRALDVSQVFELLSVVGREAARMATTITAAAPDAALVAAARDIAVTARDQATQRASEAASSASSAGQERTAAEDARTAAQQAKTDAEAAAQAALAQNFGGAVLGTADLDTITVPGPYRQPTQANATAARHYPTDALHVWEIFVRQSSVGTCIQYATPTGGSNSTRGKVTYMRRLVSGVWDPWRTMTTTRVDKTAGIAVYTWDDVGNRDQLTYGDTGWRDITALLVNGWTAAFAYLRRTLHTVELQLLTPVAPGSGTQTTLYTLPPGFVPRGGMSLLLRPASGTAPPVYGSVGSNGDVGLPLGGTPAAGGHSFTWTTTQSWPSTLPGTASGTIPNT